MFVEEQPSTAFQIAESLDLNQRDGAADLALSLRPLGRAESRANELIDAPLDVAFQVGDRHLRLFVAGGFTLERFDHIVEEHSMLKFVVLEGSFAFGATE